MERLQRVIDCLFYSCIGYLVWMVTTWIVIKSGVEFTERISLVVFTWPLWILGVVVAGYLYMIIREGKEQDE